MKTLILASSSPRRKQLLGMLYPELTIAPPNVEEPPPGNQSPEDYALELARLKAHDVAAGKPDSVVIGSDTIVVLDKKILGKPASAAEAESMLSTLSGRTHSVITSVCLTATDAGGRITDSRTFFVKTEVTFSKLEETEIKAYVATGSPLDKAGAYGIQDDLGALFVSRIEGDYYTVVGFPLNRFFSELKTFAPQLLPETFIR